MKITLLVDGNWLMMSRASVMLNEFSVSLPEDILVHSCKKFTELLSTSVSIMLNKIPAVTNVIIVADCGSWRKQIPVPCCLDDVKYKGQRKQDQKISFKHIQDAFADFLKNCQDNGVTVSQQQNMEGDDWMLYWTKKCKESTIIWSTDCDLKQLVGVRDDSFVAWTNGKELCLHKDLQMPDDVLELFMNTSVNYNMVTPITTYIKNVSYINPISIIFEKVLMGDKSDNIKPCASTVKNGRTYGVNKTMYRHIMESLPDINNVQVFKSNFEDIIQEIKSFPKFINCSKSDILEILQYNLNLVWLDEHNLPQDLFPEQVEYWQFDVSRWKHNKLLMCTPEINVNELPF